MIQPLTENSVTFGEKNYQKNERELFVFNIDLLIEEVN